MPRSPNPEAIAWYVAKSEGLLDELRAEVNGLQAHGGRLAGFAGAVLALVGANAREILDALDGTAKAFAGASLLIGSLLLVAALTTALRGAIRSRLRSDISIHEVANYTTERFATEPDLWRVHVRSIRSLLISIELLTRRADGATRAVDKAEYFFLAGLFSVGLAFATLIGTVTF
jgi:hypothetical protein